ncbi:MAG TPA: hypothetical protein VFI65_07350 [Streptosporangiaceae bacterium]|nr:hypothetical protein [Streptosporangiaceae bacterium]
MRRSQRVVMSVFAVMAAVFSLGVMQASGAPTSRPVGSVWSWGSNKWGDLGDGTTSNQVVPVAVQFQLPAGARVTSVAAGVAHTLALTSGGGVFGWGDNFQGEVGDGSTKVRHVPVPVKLPAGVKVSQIGAGCYDSIALTSKAGVLAWGRNDFGELGDGTRTDQVLPVPVKLPKGTKATAVSAGCYFSLALTSTGQVLAWGRNDSGQLGNGKTANSRRPVLVKFPAGVKIKSIWAGINTGMAITVSGQIYSWQGLPVKMKFPAASRVGTVTALASGRDFTLALTSRGQVFAWGGNSNGQLGDGNGNASSQPVKVHLPAGAVATGISATMHTGYAVTTTGQVLAWGSNENGALGNGSGTDSDVPVAVSLGSGLSAFAVSAGGITDGSDGPHAFTIVTQVSG